MVYLHLIWANMGVIVILLMEIADYNCPNSSTIVKGRNYLKDVRLPDTLYYTRMCV